MSEKTFDALRVHVNDVNWNLDELEKWFGMIGTDVTTNYSIEVRDRLWSRHLSIDYDGYMPETMVRVTGRTESEVRSILNAVTEAAAHHRVTVEEPSQPETEPPLRVFIGHGRSTSWRRIKDELQDKHDYKVEAYEVGARAGHEVRDILGSMMRQSSFALLVMTAEDETADGHIRARQNVVHEAGLFQGRLGFDRAIAVEDDVEMFSNLDGVQQIRFRAGQPEVAMSEILATLRREFGDRR